MTVDGNTHIIANNRHILNKYCKLNNVQIAQIVKKVFDLRPLAIIEQLELRKPQFAKTSNYGHFGREDQGFKWEECDKAEEIARLASIMA